MNEKYSRILFPYTNKMQLLLWDGNDIILYDGSCRRHLVGILCCSNASVLDNKLFYVSQLL